MDLKIEWCATLDNRTRHNHRMLHGQRRDVDKPFEVSENGTTISILYPAQAGAGSSDIPQSMIWNCRCTLLAWVKGFEGDTVKSSPKMGDMSFEEWLDAKPMTKEQQDQWIRDGKPNVDEWKQTANYKKVANARSDKKQFEEYQKILGKNAPKTFAKFQELKYNSGDWELFKAYKRGISSGELTPLADFGLYKETSQKIDKLLIGQKTVDGLTIKSKSYHFISRTIGSIEQRRPGVSVEQSLESLTKGKTREYANSRGYYIKGKCLVTFNVETGKLIQVNPY